MKPYVSADVVDKKIKSLSSDSYTWDPTPKAIANLINQYVNGAITQLSNHIYYAIDEGTADRLEYRCSTRCKCGSCWAWQLRDEDGVVTDEVESLSDWVPSHE